MFGKEKIKEQNIVNYFFIWVANKREMKRKMVVLLHLCPNEIEKVTKIHGHKTNIFISEKSTFVASLHFRPNWRTQNMAPEVFDFPHPWLFFSSLLSSKQWKNLHTRPFKLARFTFLFFFLRVDSGLEVQSS